MNFLQKKNIKQNIKLKLWLEEENDTTTTKGNLFFYICVVVGFLKEN